MKPDEDLGGYIDDEKQEIPDYETLVSYANNPKFPMTWFPGLIIEFVRAAYKRNVFQPGGASRTVQKLEDKEGYSVRT